MQVAQAEKLHKPTQSALSGVAPTYETSAVSTFQRTCGLNEVSLVPFSSHIQLLLERISKVIILPAVAQPYPIVTPRKDAHLNAFT